MLKVTFTANLGTDPALRYTNKGLPQLEMNAACNTRRPNKEGEWIDHTDWIRVRIMRGAESLAERLAKGTRILVTGNLQTGEYVAKDGEKRFSMDVFADEIEILSRPTTNQNGEQREQPARSTAPVNRAPVNRSPQPIRRATAPADQDSDDDSLPF